MYVSKRYTQKTQHFREMLKPIQVFSSNWKTGEDRNDEIKEITEILELIQKMYRKLFTVLIILKDEN